MECSLANITIIKSVFISVFWTLRGRSHWGYRRRAQPWGSEESLLCVLSSSPWARWRSSTEHPGCLGQTTRRGDRQPGGKHRRQISGWMWNQLTKPEPRDNHVTLPPTCCRWCRVWWRTVPGSDGTSWSNPRSSSWSSTAPWWSPSGRRTPGQAAANGSRWSPENITRNRMSHDGKHPS